MEAVKAESSNYTLVANRHKNDQTAQINLAARFKAGGQALLVSQNLRRKNLLAHSSAIAASNSKRPKQVQTENQGRHELPPYSNIE